MESFASKFFNFEDVNEDILERRISPYVTLRPGDLLALIKLHFLCPNSKKHNGKTASSHRRVDTIFEKKQHLLSSEDSDEDRSDDDDVIDMVCHGADQGHVPVEYQVMGLRRHEMPVIGVFVDRKICPGFKYIVRRIDSNNFLWDKKARTLESIGIGYGRRLTFSGDQLNNNDCYFWSDSEPNGYAFSIQAVEVGQKFIIQDFNRSDVGECVIEGVTGPQEETSMDVKKSGVVKRVNVTIACSITYYRRHIHGLKELVSAQNEELISGEAVLSKPRSSRKATLVSIDEVFLPRIGHCKLIPDN